MDPRLSSIQTSALQKSAETAVFVLNNCWSMNIILKIMLIKFQPSMGLI